MAIRATTITTSTTAIKKQRLCQAVYVAALIVIAILLANLGFAQFRDGLAVDAAIPIPVYMVAQVPVPKQAYESAAAALSQADPRDGKAALACAEARMLAGEPLTQLAEPIRQALMRQPASARGWMLLAKAEYGVDRQAAARALAQALVLAPREYWLIGARAHQAALQWSDLDSDSQALALAEARSLWQERALHPQMRELLQTPQGAALVSHAFEQEDIRAINRWLSREQQRRTAR